MDDPNPATLVALLVLAAGGAAVYAYGFRSWRKSRPPQPSHVSDEDFRRSKRNSFLFGLLLFGQMLGVVVTAFVLNPGPVGVVLIVVGWALLFYGGVRLVWLTRYR